MPHEGSLLQAAVVFLLAAVLTVPLAKRLQLGAVIGYLIAGVIIGPSGLGLIGNPQSVAHISELGVVLLLFIIGLELSPKRLWVMRKSVFGVGLAQVLLTGIVIGTVALLGFDQPLNSAVVLGHERCGAVAAACAAVSDNARFPGFIGPLVKAIVPAAHAVRNHPGDFLDNAVRENARRTAHAILKRSKSIAHAAAQGKVDVMAAHYDLDSGRVEFL